MPGLLRGITRTAAIAGTASAVGGRVRHRQEKKWAEQETPAPAQEPAVAPPVGGPSTLDQLKQLGELKEQGVLTDEEFAAQKAKLLG